MVSKAENHPEAPDEQSAPKPLNGLGLVIAEQVGKGKVTSLGVIFAPNTEKLTRILHYLHKQEISFVPADLRGGVLILQHPPKD